jgi:hypothetical protein
VLCLVLLHRIAIIVENGAILFVLFIHNDMLLLMLDRSHLILELLSADLVELPLQVSTSIFKCLYTMSFLRLLPTDLLS